MIYDLQKASIIKRFSAFLLDAILIVILTTGVAFAISAIVDFGGKLERIEQLDAECVREFELGKYLPVPENADESYKHSMNITKKVYDELSAEGKAAYDAAREAYKQKAGIDMIADYERLFFLFYLMISLGFFFAILIIEFIVPLFLKNGQTPGKKIFGVGVMLINGVKVSPIALLVRSMLGKYAIETMVPFSLVIFFLFISPTLTILLVLIAIAILQLVLLIATKNNSLIHDILSSTVTVDMSTQMIFATYDDLLAYKQEVAKRQSDERPY